MKTFFVTKYWNRTRRDVLGRLVEPMGSTQVFPRADFIEEPMKATAQKGLMSVGVFLTLVVAASSPLKADTILFSDLDDNGPTLVTSSQRYSTVQTCSEADPNCPLYDYIFGNLPAPAGMLFSSMTLPFGDLIINEDPAVNSPAWSDVVYTNPSPQSVNVNFYSLSPLYDYNNGVPSPDYCGLGYACMGETGGIQDAGTITWTDGQGNFVTDTIQFQSDVSESTVPEPASLVLLGTGVVGLIARRRKGRRSPSSR